LLYVFIKFSKNEIEWLKKKIFFSQDTPAPKQLNIEPAVDPTKCSVCNKTVYAMEKVWNILFFLIFIVYYIWIFFFLKIEADKKIYHKSCFKCMHCKSILKWVFKSNNLHFLYDFRRKKKFTLSTIKRRHFLFVSLLPCDWWACYFENVLE